MSPSKVTLSLRLVGGAMGVAAFGLIAAIAFQPWNIWVAVGLGMLFGAAYAVGAGYRIVGAVIRQTIQPTPASWAAAAAGATVVTMAVVILAAWLHLDFGYVLLAFGIAIGLAFLPTKAACIPAGCCKATRPSPFGDLRLMEIGLSAAVLSGGALLALAGEIAAAAFVAVGGHMAIRLLERRMRNSLSWGWPPFLQPAPEIFPLSVLTATALFSWIF